MDFTVDLNTTLNLVAARAQVLQDILVVAESGIHTHADLLRLRAGGCRGFLVGEGLVRSSDPIQAVRHLLGVF
jgi:indole-3-glycerol phosphate synthase